MTEQQKKTVPVIHPFLYTVNRTLKVVQVTTIYDLLCREKFQLQLGKAMSATFNNMTGVDASTWSNVKDDCFNNLIIAYQIKVGR
jgi:hypothetical protein